MGCPAKKICNVMAGSALMQDEPLVGSILEAVVKAVPDTPVTLKIPHRLGQAPTATRRMIAASPSSPASAPLAIHGRTRACGTPARPNTTPSRTSRPRRIPVIANGDITTPEKAKHVLDYTGADA
jgi:tRNA-dihydrouridine synthase B